MNEPFYTVRADFRSAAYATEDSAAPTIREGRLHAVKVRQELAGQPGPRLSVFTESVPEPEHAPVLWYPAWRTFTRSGQGRRHPHDERAERPRSMVNRTVTDRAPCHTQYISWRKRSLRVTLYAARAFYGGDARRDRAALTGEDDTH
jgi:hypothetical protein